MLSEPCPLAHYSFGFMQLPCHIRSICLPCCFPGAPAFEMCFFHLPTRSTPGRSLLLAIAFTVAVPRAGAAGCPTPGRGAIARGGSARTCALPAVPACHQAGISQRQPDFRGISCSMISCSTLDNILCSCTPAHTHQAAHTQLLPNPFPYIRGLRGDKSCVVLGISPGSAACKSMSYHPGAGSGAVL